MSSTFSTILMKQAKRLYKKSRPILIGMLILAGCAPLASQDLKEYKQTRPYLGAYVTIECFYAAGKEPSTAKAIKKCWERMEQIQKEMNAYSADGDIAEINRSGSAGVRVHQDVYQLLKDSVKFGQLTEGAFDVTIFPLVEFWKDIAKRGRLPDQAEVEDTKAKVGYQNLRFQEPDRVILTKQGMKVDLGGIVSGYACDELAAILKSYGIKNFLIDTGGEVICRGKNKANAPWFIGIQDPQNKNKILRTIELNDRAASTSGNYEKFYLVEGERLSHIINPLTGYPQKEVMSATVIASSCEQADALSTAFCVLGSQRGFKVLGGLNSVEALIIENKDGKTIQSQTKGFPSGK